MRVWYNLHPSGVNCEIGLFCRLCGSCFSQEFDKFVVKSRFPMPDRMATPMVDIPTFTDQKRG